MKITNYKEFKECLSYYKEKYPETYTTEEEIKRCLEKDYEEVGGSHLGIDVSDDNQDRCYEFNFVTEDFDVTYEFLGMAKC